MPLRRTVPGTESGGRFPGFSCQSRPSSYPSLVGYAHELRPAGELDLPAEGLRENGITAAEVRMAECLVEAMVGEWEPGKYRDEYRDDLMALTKG